LSGATEPQRAGGSLMGAPEQRQATPPPAVGPGGVMGRFGAAYANPADAYAGVPILNPPLWHDDVAVYFFCGGISSGAFVIGALADLSGERWRPLAQTAYVVAFAAMLPCPPLLIKDLGRPERFHHMLRIFKPSSPMNFGVWTLLAHSGFATLQTARALADWGVLPAAIARLLPARPLAVAGLPAALALGGYTGVLLGTTSVPVWSRSPLLGGLFMASAIASGAAAVSLASTLTGRDTPAEHAALAAIGLAAGATELALTGGYLDTTGEVAGPLRSGPHGALLHGALAGTALALALETAGLRSRSHKRQALLGALAAGAALAGGAMLRLAVVRAGHDSAVNREDNLAAMQQTARNPGWGPPRGRGGGV
ncbi:MAG: polysulfide reductase NrfD, partial [Thermomicrobiales bacterium]